MKEFQNCVEFKGGYGPLPCSINNTASDSLRVYHESASTVEILVSVEEIHFIYYCDSLYPRKNNAFLLWELYVPSNDNASVGLC